MLSREFEETMARATPRSTSACSAASTPAKGADLVQLLREEPAHAPGDQRQLPTRHGEVLHDAPRAVAAQHLDLLRPDRTEAVLLRGPVYRVDEAGEGVGERPVEIEDGEPVPHFLSASA